MSCRTSGRQVGRLVDKQPSEVLGTGRDRVLQSSSARRGSSCLYQLSPGGSQYLGFLECISLASASVPSCTISSLLPSYCDISLTRSGVHPDAVYHPLNLTRFICHDLTSKSVPIQRCKESGFPIWLFRDTIQFITTFDGEKISFQKHLLV